MAWLLALAATIASGTLGLHPAHASATSDAGQETQSSPEDEASSAPQITAPDDAEPTDATAGENGVKSDASGADPAAEASEESSPSAGSSPRPVPAHAATAPASDGQPVRPPPIERSELDRTCEEVARLDASEFGTYLLEDNSKVRLRALILRAGSATPPGLSAARSARRDAAREQAQEYIENQIRFSEAASATIEAELGAILVDPLVPEVLWAAAAIVVGENGLYELSEPILSAAFADRSALIQASSRRALHALYFYWVTPSGTADLIAATNRLEDMGALSGVGEDCSDYYREQLANLDAQARSQAIRLLELEAPGRSSERGAMARLTDADPALRGASARILGEAIASGQVEAGEVLEVLAAHLATEADAAVWYATVRALLEPLASAPLDSPELAGLRRQLELSIGTRPDLRTSIAWALTRIPWDTQNIASDSSVLVGIERTSRLFEDVALRSPIRDEDELLAVLNALEDLLRTASDAGIDLRSRPQRASETLLRLAVDPSVTNDIRSGAAAALAQVAPVEDVSLLVTVLESEGLSTSLAYTLLGALGRMAEFTRPESQSATVVLDALVAHTEHADVDLRSRALSLLLEPALEPLTRLTRPAIWIERLEQEDQPALQSSLLKLLARHGRISNLERLLASPAFDRILAGEPRQVADLTEVLRIWTTDHPARAMEAARRLARTGNPVHLQRALSLMASLDRDQAASLDVASHCQVHEWAFEFARTGSVLHELETPEGKFLERLLDLHLPRCAANETAPGSGSPGGASPGGGNFAHQRAVLSGILLQHNPGSLQREQVESLFDEALAFNEEWGNPAAAVAIRLDRARFKASIGERAGALSEFQEAWQIAQAEAVDHDWTAGDLRLAAQLSTELSDSADQALQAALFLETLATREAWTQDSPEQRLADLQAWVDRALASHDVIRIEAVRLALEPNRLTGLEAHAQSLEVLRALLEHHGEE